MNTRESRCWTMRRSGVFTRGGYVLASPRRLEFWSGKWAELL
jgi:hypothetical protein